MDMCGYPAYIIAADFNTAWIFFINFSCLLYLIFIVAYIQDNKCIFDFLY